MVKGEEEGELSLVLLVSLPQLFFFERSPRPHLFVFELHLGVLAALLEEHYSNLGQNFRDFYQHHDRLEDNNSVLHFYPICSYIYSNLFPLYVRLYYKYLLLFDHTYFLFLRSLHQNSITR